MDQLCNKLENKENICLKEVVLMELMANYLKVMRADKVLKIHSEIVKGLKAKGLENTIM